mmetsp:Transcript_4590/g.6397  ORF Transcript_4590/g.6397 Transcript_4590/m.6397 type:complete len:438 (+) Transcript_4590:148-1461(+)
MANKKKGSNNKKKAKSQGRNHNATTVLSLKRLLTALKELDEKGKDAINKANKNCSGQINIGIALKHWRELPDVVLQAYKMLSDSAELIRATSTKYTLLSKISVEDGSKLCDELRQACELVSTSAFLLHQAEVGCARSTRYFIKQRAIAIVSAVTQLIESMQNLRGLEGNVGAQLTGVLWSACDEVPKLPRGNRACMRREIFKWVGECNETMEEFAELVKASESTAGDIDSEDTALKSSGSEGGNGWDDFCENVGTGENYTSDELPIVRASLAIIKCSRGILGLALKAYECAGNIEAAAEDTNEDNKLTYISKEDIPQIGAILQWMSNLQEISRLIGVGVTDLGCLMYPPLNFDLSEKSDAKLEKIIWSNTQIGEQLLAQKDYLLTAAHFIIDATPYDQSIAIPMSEEVKELSSKLLAAIETRAEEASQGISDLLNTR